MNIYLKELFTYLGALQHDRVRYVTKNTALLTTETMINIFVGRERPKM